MPRHSCPPGIPFQSGKLDLTRGTGQSTDMIAHSTGKRGQRCRCFAKQARTPVESMWRLAFWTWLAFFSANQVARAGTLVQFNFNVPTGVDNAGSVMVDLFDDLTPATVTNFLNYVNSGEYQNTIIHRSLPGFVVQGGGYGITANLNDTSPFPHIATNFPSPVNEYSRANTRGTIAMAKLPGAPNSATSEWFFNLADNSAVLGPSQDGGFTAFGWVVGPGMTNVVDKIAADKGYDYKNFVHNPAVDPGPSFPLQNFTSQPVLQSNLTVLNSITVVGTHASFQNPILATDVTNDGLVHADDALAIINDLLNTNNNQSHPVSGPLSGISYLDVNGDGNINASDAHLVINALLDQSATQSTASSTTATDVSMSMAVVPEPSAWILAASGTLALGGYVLRRRRPPANLRSSHQR
jgi:cyclophilin family peptidyl-prolyl cis-trans isomerase